MELESLQLILPLCHPITRVVLLQLEEAGDFREQPEGRRRRFLIRLGGLPTQGAGFQHGLCVRAKAEILGLQSWWEQWQREERKANLG